MHYASAKVSAPHNTHKDTVAMMTEFEVMEFWEECPVIPSLRNIMGSLNCQLFIDTVAVMTEHQEGMAQIVLIIQLSLYAKDLF